MLNNAAIIEARSTKHEPIHVIISHDVDYLPSHGLTRIRQCISYFIRPRTWYRLARNFLTGRISFKVFIKKFIYSLQKKKNHFPQLMAIDKAHGVKATYFFGMNQGLGLVYHPEDAKPVIELVRSNGFDAGVHGIVFDDFDGMRKEYDTWTQLMGTPPESIRMHYVRYDDKLFERLSRVGYAYDSTEFHKPERKTIKAPYKVGSMWEFPLNIMEGYLVPKNEVIDDVSAETLKRATLQIIDELKAQNIHYLTILVHDPYYSFFYDGVYEWYQWLLQYLSDSPDFDFVSYREAVALLEEEAKS